MGLDEKLAAGEVIVLDGATGTEIARLGGEMNPAAWCAVANRDHPDIVRGVHESYLEAGADVITTNTFATCRHVLEGAGLGDETVAINRCAVELAREARDRVAPGRAVAIAGSMSNTVAWRPGTVGPDPAYFPSPEEETANYREMADTLAEAGCDLLVMEMMMDVARATRVTEAALATGLPVWIGISASQGSDGTMIGWDVEREENGRLPEGYSPPPREALETIIDALVALGPRAVGIMHSSVESTSPGLRILYERWDGPVMAYPEVMRFDSAGHLARVLIEPEEFASLCRGWVEGGAQIIGGCCGTTVSHIRAMVDALPERPGPRPPPLSRLPFAPARVPRPRGSVIAAVRHHEARRSGHPFERPLSERPRPQLPGRRPFESRGAGGARESEARRQLPATRSAGGQAGRGSACRASLPGGPWPPARARTRVAPARAGPADTPGTASGGAGPRRAPRG